MADCAHPSTTDLSYRVEHIVCHACKSHHYQGRWINRQEWDAWIDADPERVLAALMPAAQFAERVLRDILEGRVDLEDVSAAGAGLVHAREGAGEGRQG